VEEPVVLMLEPEEEATVQLPEVPRIWFKLEVEEEEAPQIKARALMVVRVELVVVPVE
jgi:hypothetical protein